METDIFLLSISFFLIALCYSTVGFGGGSSYLAILVFAGVSTITLRPTALLCNIIVVAGGTFLFQKAKFINFKKALPLIITSVPMAFIGGYWLIKDPLFNTLLGISLLLSAILLWIQPTFSRTQLRIIDNKYINAAIGGGIGLLAGLVSIGGGIFLAPVLYFIRWNDAKYIAAMASLFILVNSIAGLAGRLLQSTFNVDFMFILPLLFAVLLGGQIGSRLSINWLDSRVIKRITAVLIFILSIRMLYKHLI